MVTASAGVQTDLSHVVHPSCRPICHSSEPQSSTVGVDRPDQNAWDIDALNINWWGLTAYAYPPTALLHRVIQKIRQCSCLITVIAPGWPGMPWFWDLVHSSHQRSHFSYQCQQLFSNSSTTMCFTAIQVSTSTPGV